MKYFCLGHYQFLTELTVFLKLSSQKTVRFPEQIVPADKYPSIFLRQMETIVYVQVLTSFCRSLVKGVQIVIDLSGLLN